MCVKEICIDARLILGGGLGTYIRNVILGLKDEYKMRLLVHPESVQQLRWLETFELIPFLARVYSIEEQIKLPLLVPKCDLFWSPHYNVPVAPIKARRRLVTIHDVYHLAFYSELTVKEKLYVKGIFKAAVSLSHHVITVSHFSRGELLRYASVRPEKVSVIYHGVDHAVFKAQKGLRRKEILYVGNVKPHKNLRRLIQAFRLLLERGFGEYRLVIAGKNKGFLKGDDLSALIEQDKVLKDKVVLLGFVEDRELPGLYAQAELAIFPSLYEGFGMPPLEAMACGCPVVVSHAASFPEICQDAVRYVDPYDVEAMAGVIEAILKNPQAEWRKKGIERAAYFRWDKSASEHTLIINGVLGEGFSQPQKY